ncbi:hypothetical protein BGW38_001320 [Lunasporangiospora selenospora]|uniref:Uncharacterized protein n=1 Tax=Lunasporangiospora selenospora TaxID=979761 RepID=A0A9P6G198_9FUNG|nr:hypothetical protein BGW38_001320 [Lunasporangiospora selenospora]
MAFPGRVRVDAAVRAADLHMVSPTVVARGDANYTVIDELDDVDSLVLQAYIAFKCEGIEQEEQESDQEAEREIGLLDPVQDGDNCGKRAGKGKSKRKNKKESQPITAETIRSVWRFHYTQRDGSCIGNPANDIGLSQYIQTLGKQLNREGVIRRKIAITLQSMEKLMAYLDRPAVQEEHGLAKCLFFQAYAPTGFYLWAK